MAESTGKKLMRKLLLHTCCVLMITSCAAQKPSAKKDPLQELLADTIFRSAHIGVSVYDPAARRPIYNYQGGKYFVPASNVKIATCYAVMRYMKHILPGVRYYENDTAVYLVPTGDPTFLHRDFPVQPVFDFLKKQKKKIYITDSNWKDKELGKGWSWDDFSDEYMVERNSFPVYGNTLKWVQEKIKSNLTGIEESFSVYSDPEVNWKVKFEADSGFVKFKVTRDRLSNVFRVAQGNEPYKETIVPFMVNGLSSALELLPDTLGKSIQINNNFFLTDPQQRVVWSQPTDSVLRPMMYNSDNFFAEQLLLMVSEEKTGVFNDEVIIDTITRHLKNEVVWVDGSGLSRYNLFTPDAFVEILDSMRSEFGMERVKGIFPTGDSGTLKGYYVANNGKIYAKTGSMSGVLALSGFLYGKNNRLMIFSVLVNNFNGTGSNGRRAIERFIKKLLQ
jgi:D-alanyl-D-alanine carboxypeptidase/D-alanyl-D-alanine-endopeptidase (penicillin-binding protein 4)